MSECVMRNFNFTWSSCWSGGKYQTQRWKWYFRVFLVEGGNKVFFQVFFFVSLFCSCSVRKLFISIKLKFLFTTFSYWLTLLKLISSFCVLNLYITYAWFCHLLRMLALSIATRDRLAIGPGFKHTFISMDPIVISAYSKFCNTT